MTARAVRWPAICLLLGGSVLLPSVARGDAGMLRYRKVIDGVEISVFSDSPPIRTGIFDVNILVEPVPPNARRPAPIFQVCAYPVDSPEKKHRADEIQAPAMNKLFTAAELEITEQGRWQVEIDADVGGTDLELCRFEIDVVDAPARLGVWVGLPAAVIVLFAAHRWLVHRRQRRLTRPASPGVLPS
jgi:hypothetical protein